jgi:hypothetical protein
MLSKPGLVASEDDEVVVVADLSPYPIPDVLDLPPLDAARKDRFPSVEERIKVYMSNWYLPSCTGSGGSNNSITDRGKVKYKFLFSSNSSSVGEVWIQEPRNLAGTNSTEYVVDSKVVPDTAFFVNRTLLAKCGDPKTVPQIKNLRSLYCPDAVSTLLVALDHLRWEEGKNGGKEQEDEVASVPILVQFGDMRYSHRYRYMNSPLIKKFRSATTSSELKKATTAAAGSCLEVREKMKTAHNQPSLEPVVWKLSTPRHFGMLQDVYRLDTPWELKKDMAIFRGQLTGSVDGYDRHKTPEQNCLTLRRCRLVYRHAGSALVDALLTSTRDRIPDSINNVTLVSRKVSLDYLLRYKGIVMLEGNDVASGLKWALLSQSVVLMPVPRHTSWAMEELLEPWVHYVPLNDDASDVEQKMRWVVDHDDLARRIAQRGSLWMQDLVFHPESAEDDRLVQEGMLRRYIAHFAPADDESVRVARRLLR